MGGARVGGALQDVGGSAGAVRRFPGREVLRVSRGLGGRCPGHCPAGNLGGTGPVRGRARMELAYPDSSLASRTTVPPDPTVLSWSPGPHSLTPCVR